MGTNLWIPRQSPRAQRTMSSPPWPGRGVECLGVSGFLLSPAWSVPSPVSQPMPLQVLLASQCSVYLSGVQTLSLRL